MADGHIPDEECCEECDLEAEAADYLWHTPIAPAYKIDRALTQETPGQFHEALSSVLTNLYNRAGMKEGPLGSYQTKDSGEHREFDGGGRRDSSEGKPRFDLLFPRTVPYQDQMLTRVAELFERGARKYSGRNWEQFSSPEALEHAEGSFGRHSAQYMCGEKDEDHAAAVIANVLIIEYIKGVIQGRWNALEAS